MNTCFNLYVLFWIVEKYHLKFQDIMLIMKIEDITLGNL